MAGKSRGKLCLSEIEAKASKTIRAQSLASAGVVLRRVMLMLGRLAGRFRLSISLKRG